MYMRTKRLWLAAGAKGAEDVPSQTCGGEQRSCQGDLAKPQAGAVLAGPAPEQQAYKTQKAPNLQLVREQTKRRLHTADT